MHQLLAGTGRVDITPAPGTPQGGWGAQTHQRGLGADLPFYATALVFRDAGLVLRDASLSVAKSMWTRLGSIRNGPAAFWMRWWG